MGEEWRPVWNLLLVKLTNMLFLYMFFVFPLFSLSTCVPGPACYGCVICCRFIWYLPSPWLWIKRTQKPPLIWGSSMGFLFVFFSCFVYSPSLFSFSLAHISHLSSTSLSLSIFLFFLYCALAGVQDEVCEKKPKVFSDTSGLVPYGGDSSDEEEERSRSSKTDNS